MEPLLIFWLGTLLTFGDHAQDPVQQVWKEGRQAARELDCERMSQAQAHDMNPADVPATSARGMALVRVDAMVCKRRIVGYGERDARDEFILSSLRADMGAMTKQAATGISAQTTWRVDAFYPNPKMVQKINVAARTALAESGHQVSSQSPFLAAGDIAVMQGLAMAQALPLACTRMYAEGSLAETDAFLALALLNPSESELHAGVCQQGSWRWLR
jgi:hypothetical protein